MASTKYAGDSWASAVVVLQRVHVLLRLFSGSPTVAVPDYNCCDVFPRGKVWGVVDIVFYICMVCHPTRFVLLGRLM